MSAHDDNNGDSLLINKIVGALLAMALVIAALHIGTSEFIFKRPHGMAKAYTIEVPDADGKTAVKEEPDLGALLLSANVESGLKQFNGNCSSCHIVDKSGTVALTLGPNLWGVVGRKIAADSEWKYSGAMRDFANEKDGWDDQSIFDFLYNPKRYVKGTAMTYAGMKNPEKRADLIAYLRSVTDNPPEPPAPRVVAQVSTAQASIASDQEQVPAILQDAENVDAGLARNMVDKLQNTIAPVENIADAVNGAKKDAVEPGGGAVPIEMPTPEASYKIVGDGDEQDEVVPTP